MAIDWNLPILDIASLIVSLVALIISVLAAYGIFRTHNKLSDIHQHLKCTQACTI